MKRRPLLFGSDPLQLLQLLQKLPMMRLEWMQSTRVRPLLAAQLLVPPLVELNFMKIFAIFIHLLLRVDRPEVRSTGSNSVLAQACRLGHGIAGTVGPFLPGVRASLELEKVFKNYSEYYQAIGHLVPVPRLPSLALVVAQAIRRLRNRRRLQR